MTTPQNVIAEMVRMVSLPDIYVRCKALLDDPNASIYEIGNIIGADPGMTSRLLRIANSAFFGMRGRVGTVRRAITLLGTRQLHDLILATSVTRAFAGIPEYLVDMHEFWWKSVHCGVVARLVASQCHVLDTERMFVAGLLRELGHLVLYQNLPDQAREAMILARQSGQPIHEAEREVLGFDYADVGGELMRAWELPESLQESVGMHLKPAEAQTHLLEVAIVHIAAVIAEVGEDTETPLDEIATFDEAALRTTGLYLADLEPIREVSLQQATEAVELIFPATSRAS